ncbi:VWA domain-containing protein [Simiduia sp. 21SJ11W-1]|uniref:VWA domain-containing protein n=1 Tax=Simiduia sp. 21SJ11W-1 TaxID=2909669 RepID=UPI00209E5937|nr:VWA domain-containing protein [Simiduia sp. 21SJ11W-1]UTA49359.1 VWA domain-containing protein [Simiduia sp. 21SJ11W-1]
MLSIEWPWLFALLPLPWLVRAWLPNAARTSPTLAVPAAILRGANTNSDTQAQHKNRKGLLVMSAIWLCLLTAASNPRWQGEPIELPASGRDLLLAVDISGSMKTPDMQFNNQSVSRLVAVKAVVQEFVTRRHGDRLGLILFGTQAYLQAPLTFDRTTVGRLLQEAQLGFAGENTAIGDAIGLAVKRLRERPEASRVMILLTDGANTAGTISPRQAAEVAAAANVKIYTIGLGASQMQVPGLLGSQFGARTVNPSVDLDESTLTHIAKLTGGQYFRAHNPQELHQIYALLDELEPAAQDAEVFRPSQSLFHWPLALALLLSITALVWAQLANRFFASEVKHV